MELIYAYSRKQAIKDGVLVDVTDTAKEAGFGYPVSVTAEVWARYVKVPPGVSGQDEIGRLWDILWMLRYSIRTANSEHDSINNLHFKLHVRQSNGEGEPPLVTLKAVCGPGDDAEPVITIMLPHED